MGRAAGLDPIYSVASAYRHPHAGIGALMFEFLTYALAAITIVGGFKLVANAFED